MIVAITVSGRQMTVDDRLSLADFLTRKGIEPGTVVVEYNHNIISSDNLAKIILQENDNLEILRFMGGG